MSVCELQFGQLIAVLCKEVPQLKTARTSANKFLETGMIRFYVCIIQQSILVVKIAKLL